MSRSACLISEHPASSDDIAKFKRAIEFLQGRFTYKRVKDGYDCYCSRCGQHFTLKCEQLQQTKEAGLCFRCAHPVKVVQRRITTAYPKQEWLYTCNETGCFNGYYVLWEGTEGDIQIVATRQVLHYDEFGGRYLYGVVKNMGFSITRTNTREYWRKERSSYNAYINYFYSVEEALAEEVNGKKDYYEKQKLSLKSNQATFVKKGIYNENQLKYIQLFDLNYPEELHKYKDYISRHRIFDSDEFKGSVNVLDYIVRHNYSVSDYRDYLRACKTLGIAKPEKYPKDLYEAHDRLMKIIDAKKNEVYEQRIKERHELLKTQEWQKGSFAVKTFTDFSDMQEVANTLKNCISRMYVKPYAEERTDVYYGTENGEITFAFEVTQKKLIQLRTFCNKSVNDETRAFVKEWCKKYAVSYSGE